MAASWTDFLRVPTPSAHAVQVYDGVDELAESVAAFLTAGLRVGDPALLVATAQHRDVFTAALAAGGWAVADLEDAGLLQIADAGETLEAILDGGMPSPLRFERHVGARLDAIAARYPGREIRAFGEMVELLNRRGRIDAALALEDLWNAAARTRRFSLLCGYQLDIFDLATQHSPLPDVCRVHSHVIPSAHLGRLSDAVDAALNDEFGTDGATEVYLSVGEHGRLDTVPLPQLALMWVSEHRPEAAGRVLDGARRHYADASA
jgi:hypothetical protein